MSGQAEGELSFARLLAELQNFIGERVVVESLARDGYAFHESRGVLRHSIDLQVTIPGPLDRPAHIAFCLDAGGCFTVREQDFLGAWAFTLPGDDSLPGRVVEIELAGGELTVRDDWEQVMRDRLATATSGRA